MANIEKLIKNLEQIDKKATLLESQIEKEISQIPINEKPGNYQTKIRKEKESKLLKGQSK